MESWTIDEVAADIVEFIGEKGSLNRDGRQAYPKGTFIGDFREFEELGIGVESKIHEALQMLKEQGRLKIGKESIVL